MLPPRILRRLLLVPLVIVIAGALVALAPALAALSVVFAIIRRRFGRMRALRIVYIALIWSLGEAAALAVFLCLWIISGFGGRLETEPYRTRHYGVMRWFLDLIYDAAQRACGLRVEVECPAADGMDSMGAAASPGAPASAGAVEPEARPVIVLSRHAGPGDSLLLVRYLLAVCGRRPRVVMKATLQLDPSLDIVANRLPNAFIKRHKAGPRSQTDQVRRLARTLDGDGALLLFPEGANWTPLRWRRAIERLRRDGHPGLAERAAAMPNVLPPRPGGALTAIASCPAADVIFVAHTGTDRLVSVRDIWRCLSADISIRARWWRVPACDVPRAADYEAQVRWLYDWWQRIDAWITSQHMDDAPDSSPEAPAVPR